VTALERPGPQGQGDDKDDVPAAQLRAALNVAIKAKPDLFTDGEVGTMTEVTNAGWGLKQIQAFRPGLALKAKQALALLGDPAAA